MTVVAKTFLIDEIAFLILLLNTNCPLLLYYDSFPFFLTLVFKISFWVGLFANLQHQYTLSHPHFCSYFCCLMQMTIEISLLSWMWNLALSSVILLLIHLFTRGCNTSLLDSCYEIVEYRKWWNTSKYLKLHITLVIIPSVFPTQLV